jgi:sugar phosphate isomerase/epimerase
MEFSCHTWAFHHLSLAEAFGTIARLGFRCVDIGSGPALNVACAVENPRRMAAEIKADLAAYNLRLADLYLMLPRISLADDERRQREILLFRSLMPFAVELGAPGVTLSPGIIHPPKDRAAYKRTVAALKEMAEAGCQAGLRVSIEPHLDSMAESPAAALKLVKAVPELEITLDWAQMVCQNISRDKILDLLPHTRHIHLRQATHERLQTPFEQGTIDLARVVSDLQAANYQGTVCVEYMPPHERHGLMTVDPIQESARLRDVLRAARDGKKEK